MSNSYAAVDEKRFAFGDNWQAFLASLNEDRIAQAEASLKSMLDVADLSGKTFLDIGSGSGLFSLAARRLGAKVHSFDYDPQSVACTRKLQERFFPGDANWTVEQGSVLDAAYLEQLGRFDVVYSWGVLHHTGDMWSALKNAEQRVADGGRLFIALYNDQGFASKVWLAVKKLYVSLPVPARPVLVAACLLRLWGPTLVKDFLKLQPFASWRTYVANRGMSPYRDVVDWVGGYPFEVSTPEQIFDFYRGLSYRLDRLRTCAGGLGCNEFVFTRT